MFGFIRRWFQAGDGSLATTRESPLDEVESSLIRACRERLGPSPRALWASDSETFRMELNPQLESLLTQGNDPLLQIVADQPALVDRGHVVWGHLVQANSTLFDPSNQRTLPANVIYSLDPYFDGRVCLLADIAHSLFAQKGSVPAERELREFVRVITDEYERIMRRELPRPYCGGRSVYFTTCLIQPGHLPGNCLVSQSFPLLVNFDETQSVMILPSRFWPEQLAMRWQTASSQVPVPAQPQRTGAQLLTITPPAAKQIREALREAGVRYLRVAWVVAETRDGRPVSFRRSVSVVETTAVDDVVIESEGVTIVIDSLSAKYFENGGEILDYATTDDGRGGFTFRGLNGG